jgi:hypothetical protein
MKSLINIIFVALLLISLQANAAERISKSERASITTLSILSVYESKCEDLTPFGYESFIQVVRHQESKGRNIYLMEDYQAGLKRTLGFFKSNGRTVACRELRKIIKSMPLFNQMIN